MSATATRASGPQRTGPVRAGGQRAGGQRAGGQRTGVHRTGALRAGPRSVPVRPELRLVPPSRARAPRGSGTRSSRAPFVLLVVALLAGTTLALLVLNTAIAVDSLKATSLRQGNTTREQEVQRLEQQVIDGTTPQSVAGNAARAGLVPAGTPGYLVVQPDGTATLRGTPSPAPVPAVPAAPGIAPGVVPAPTVPTPAAGVSPSPAPAAGADQVAGD